MLYEHPHLIYSSDEIYGGKRLILFINNTTQVIGEDVTYNSRRRILASMPVTGTIGYHLFAVNTSFSTDKIKLVRRSKWPLKYGTQRMLCYVGICGV
jgi:hypothetical protein